MRKPALQIIKLPSESGIDSLLKKRVCRDADIVAIPDNEGAAPGLDALVRAADWLQADYRVALCFNCRDRNRIDLASRYNGAVHLGVSFIVIETGHHTRQGPVPEAKPVYDLDPLQTLNYLNQLQKKVTLNDPPVLGLRTSVQRLDDFEFERINQICRAQPGFLLIRSGKSLDHVNQWIVFCRKIAGFDKITLVWEGFPGIRNSDEGAVKAPDGIHGLFSTY